MKQTPRFLNRAFLFVTGLALLAAGGLTIAYLVSDEVRKVWRRVAAELLSFAKDTGEIAGYQLSFHWGWIAAVITLVLLAILLVVLITRQGGGKVATLLRVKNTGLVTETGHTTVATKVIEDLLQQRFSNDPEVLSLSATGFEVKGQRTLRVTAQLRRGANLPEIVTRFDNVTAELDKLLGKQIPMFLELTSGVRTAINHNQRVR